MVVLAAAATVGAAGTAAGVAVNQMDPDKKAKYSKKIKNAAKSACKFLLANKPAAILTMERLEQGQVKVTHKKLFFMQRLLRKKVKVDMIVDITGTTNYNGQKKVTEVISDTEFVFVQHMTVDGKNFAEGTGREGRSDPDPNNMEGDDAPNPEHKKAQFLMVPAKLPDTIKKLASGKKGKNNKVTPSEKAVEGPSSSATDTTIDISDGRTVSDSPNKELLPPPPTLQPLRSPKKLQPLPLSSPGKLQPLPLGSPGKLQPLPPLKSMQPSNS